MQNNHVNQIIQLQKQLIRQEYIDILELIKQFILDENASISPIVSMLSKIKYMERHQDLTDTFQRQQQLYDQHIQLQESELKLLRRTNEQLGSNIQLLKTQLTIEKSNGPIDYDRISQIQGQENTSKQFALSTPKLQQLQNSQTELRQIQENNDIVEQNHQQNNKNKRSKKYDFAQMSKERIYRLLLNKKTFDSIIQNKHIADILAATNSESDYSDTLSSYSSPESIKEQVDLWKLQQKPKYSPDADPYILKFPTIQEDMYLSGINYTAPQK